MRNGLNATTIKQTLVVLQQTLFPNGIEMLYLTKSNVT